MRKPNALSDSGDLGLLRRTRRKILAELQRSDLFRDLRDEYARIIVENGVTHAENISRLSDWVVYLYYCSMINHLEPEKNAHIVDWGGGNGHVTQVLRAMGYSNVKNYLLYVPGYYQLFQRRFDIPTLFGEDPNRLNLSSESVDVFISSGVLEHVREDGIGREEVILAEIHRVLKPNGLLFIWNLPAMLSTSELLCIITSRWRHKYVHKYRYWKSTVIRLLGAAGFDVIYLDKHTFMPGAVMRLLEGKINPGTLMAVDDFISRIFPFSIFARNFGIVAKKSKTAKASS